ncbi:MAG: protein kinase [Kofleriaceae bacterium]
MSTTEEALAQRLVGRVLDDKYRLRGCIGIGGSGAVYKADQVALGRTVAVKILNDELTRDPRLVKRFQDEALAASRLNHPNTVSIIDYGQTDDGLLYLVMEYLRGPTLTHLIAKEHPLPPARVLGILEQVLAGVEEAHLAGVIHADLKSDNIIVEQRRTGADQVKVVDFGIARLVNAPREGEDRNICGTPEYMAPELIAGNPPTVFTDLYALGIVAYELLTGQTPFVGGSAVDILTRQLKLAPQPPSAVVPVSPAIDELVMRALAKRPLERFADAAAMRAAVVAAGTPARVAAGYACEACGAQSAVAFRFCPDCGQPRATASTTAALADTADAGGLVELPVVAWPLGLVGRDRELDLVADFLAGRSAAPALLVVGEMGSGRTALLREAYERVAEAIGVTIYQADADPTGLASSLYPLRALIATMLELPPVCSVDDLVAVATRRGLNERDVPGLAELFGNATELSELDGPVRRREMFASFVRTLAAEATRGPTVLVFEDLDRYDRTSADMVRRLVERDASGVRIVVTVTEAEANTWPVDCIRVSLGPLDDEALTFLAAQLGRHPEIDAITAGHLAELTHGAPAHVEQLARYLAEGGSLEHAPTTLPDLIAARLANLSKDSLVVCQSAAVFGREVTRDSVEASSGLGDGFGPALATAVERGWLRVAEPVIEFVSVRVRDVVYGAIPASVRRDLHDFARVTLEPTGAANVLAHHTEAAGLRAEAAALYVTAGDLAVHQLDELGAARCFSQALVCARGALANGDLSPAELVSISIRLADVLRATGELALARGILHEAESWGDQGPHLQALVVRSLGQLVATERDPAAAVPFLQRAIGAAIATGDGSLIAETYLDLASVLIRQGKSDAAARELQESIDMMTLGDGPRSPRGPDNLWKVVLKLAQVAAASGDLHRAAEQAEYALAQAQRVNAAVGVARSRALLASAYEKLGNHILAERHRRGAVDEMRRMGDRRGTAELLLYGAGPGRTLMKLGAEVLQEAQELAQEVGWTEGQTRASAVRDR